MKRETELAKNTAIITIGKVCTQFANFLLLPLYTSQLATEEYGLYDLLMTVMSMLLPVVLLQTEQAMFRYLAENRSNERVKKEIISTESVFSLATTVGFSLLILVFGRFFWAQGYIALSGMLLAGSLSWVSLQLARGVGDSFGYSLANFITATVMIGLDVFFIVVLKMQATGLVLAYIIGNLACVVFVYFREKAYKYQSIKGFEKKRLVDMLKYSLPLVPSSMAWWVVGSCDRVIVSIFLTMSDNGILAVATKFTSAMNVIYQMFYIAWAETIVSHYKEDDFEQFFNNMVSRVMRIGFSLCTGLVGLLPLVFGLLVDESFAQAYLYIPIYCAALLLCIFVGIIEAVYIAHKKTMELSKSSVLAAVVNIVVGVALIKPLGLFAAPVSSVVAYGTMLVYRLSGAKHMIRFRPDKRLIACMTGLFAACSACYYVRTPLSLTISAVFSVFGAFFFNRELLSGVYISIRAKIKGFIDKRTDKDN